PLLHALHAVAISARAAVQPFAVIFEHKLHYAITCGGSYFYRLSLGMLERIGHALLQDAKQLVADRPRYVRLHKLGLHRQNFARLGVLDERIDCLVEVEAGVSISY